MIEVLISLWVRNYFGLKFDSIDGNIVYKNLIIIIFVHLKICLSSE